MVSEQYRPVLGGDVVDAVGTLHRRRLAVGPEIPEASYEAAVEAIAEVEDDTAQGGDGEGVHRVAISFVFA